MSHGTTGWTSPPERTLRRRALALSLVVLGLLSPVLGRPAIAGIAERDTSGWFPATPLYDTYLADIRKSADSQLGFGPVPSRDIDGAGSPRAFLKAGGSYGIYRHKGQRRPFDWQIAIDAAFSSQFDIENSYDSIGWDGWLGLIGSFALDSGLDFRVGALHDSSHIGDELIESTGRLRIDYTREEYLLGVSKQLADRWRLYAEAGYAYTNRADPQEPIRWQGGVEFKAPGTAFRGTGGWYGALDLASYEEKDYQVDVSLQGGVYFTSNGSQWRLAVTAYHGSVPIGEFFQDDETYVILGLHANL